MDDDTLQLLGGTVLAVLGLAGTAVWRLAVYLGGVRRDLEKRQAAGHAELRRQMEAAQMSAQLALQQNVEIRAEVAEKYVTKEGVREALNTIERVMLAGFQHVGEVNALNFKRLEEQIGGLRNALEHRRPRGE